MLLREADWGGGASIIEGGLVYCCGLRRECKVESQGYLRGSRRCGRTKWTS